MMIYNQTSLRELLEKSGFSDIFFFPAGTSMSEHMKDVVDVGVTHSLFCEVLK